MNGINSLLNQNKNPYHRGDRIKFIGHDGKMRQGTYVMASSLDGAIVLNMGGRHGTPQVVDLNSVIK